MDRQNLDPIEVTIDGKKHTKYVLSDKCTGKGADYTCPQGGRGYIHNTPDYDISNPDFFKMNLMGSQVEFDVDMSQADCGTINTFYTVTIPATTAEGRHAEDGFYYCDSIAGRWGGQYCPELDIM